MSSIVRWGVACLAAAAFLAPPLVQARGDGPPTVKDVGVRMRGMLGDDVVAAVLRASRAEAFRLEEPSPRARAKPMAPTVPGTISGYRARGAGKPLDEDLFNGFRATFLEASTYPPPEDVPEGTGVGAIKLCGGFRPGVAIRFWAKDQASFVDALICFNCFEVGFATKGAKEVRAPYDVAPARRVLLQLVASVFPEDEAFLERLEETQEPARERLFLSMFPPRTQLAMQPPADSLDLSAYRDRDELVRTEGQRLAKSVPGPTLIRNVSRALAWRSSSWTQRDTSTEIVLAATKQVPLRDAVSALESMAGDQLAMAGFAELATRGGLAGRLPDDVRVEWLPRLAEAAIAASPNAEPCVMLTRVADLPAGKGIPFVLRVAQGKVRAAERWGRSPRDLATVRGCALLALVKVDPPRATAEARAWAPTEPVDQATRKAVLFLAGRRRRSGRRRARHPVARRRRRSDGVLRARAEARAAGTLAPGRVSSAHRGSLVAGRVPLRALWLDEAGRSLEGVSRPTGRRPPYMVGDAAGNLGPPRLLRSVGGGLPQVSGLVSGQNT